MRGEVLFRMRPFRDPKDGSYPMDHVTVKLDSGKWLKLDAKSHNVDEGVQPGVLVEIATTGILWWKKYRITPRQA